MANFMRTMIKGAYLIKENVFKDERGFFMQTFEENELEELLKKNNEPFHHFVQDNMSYNKKKYIFRGFHIQKPPYCQSKIVRCVKGEIFDIIIDIRTDSPTYLNYQIFYLSDKNATALYVPRGCLHSYLTVSKKSLITYKVDNYYNKESDRTISFVDMAHMLDIRILSKVESVSDKDKSAPYYKDSDLFESITEKNVN